MSFDYIQSARDNQKNRAMMEQFHISQRRRHNEVMPQLIHHVMEKHDREDIADHIALIENNYANRSLHTITNHTCIRGLWKFFSAKELGASNLDRLTVSSMSVEEYEEQGIYINQFIVWLAGYTSLTNQQY